MSTQPTTGGHDHAHDHAHDHHDDHAAAPAVTDTDELEGVKMVALESAELATRSANLAVGAGENMKKATQNLENLMKVNKKQHQIMLGVSGGLMVLVAIIFATVVFSLKSRITQMDAMLAAMSKHIVELNDSMEMVGSVNEGLQAMISKQDEISKAQSSLEARLNEAIKNAESVPEKTAQQVGEKRPSFGSPGQVSRRPLHAAVQSFEQLGQPGQWLARCRRRNWHLQERNGSFGPFAKRAPSC